MLYAVLLFLHVLCCGGFVLDGLSGPANLYVSTHGRDHNNGHDIHHPVRTLSQALSQLKLSTYSNRDVTINLMQGYHDLDATVHITHRSPHTITIQAHKDEEVHVTGGKRIPSNMFHKVTDTTILHRLPPESRHKIWDILPHMDFITTEKRPSRCFIMAHLYVLRDGQTRGSSTLDKC